uniref:Predicted protein n=1 Tax=Hordeum vulgare subsp. vulgare TaxID=112509 RepID=F2CXF1_HORVV|nr:predicted protein [Hordeum vulgare subsp. vulgare]
MSPNSDILPNTSITPTNHVGHLSLHPYPLDVVLLVVAACLLCWLRPTVVEADVSHHTQRYVLDTCFST